MAYYKLGVIESRFADIIWDNEPVSTAKLIELCLKELNWKRTTTYTVLKRLCERGIFQTVDSTVSSLISRDNFTSTQSELFIDESFGGSLPAFLAAFTKNKKLSEKEISEIRKMISEYDAH
jgi:predicted transcriptional regulator